MTILVNLYIYIYKRQEYSVFNRILINIINGILLNMNSDILYI